MTAGTLVGSFTAQRLANRIGLFQIAAASMGLMGAGLLLLTGVDADGCYFTDLFPRWSSAQASAAAIATSVAAAHAAAARRMASRRRSSPPRWPPPRASSPRRCSARGPG